MRRKPHLEKRLGECSDILLSPELTDKNMKRAALEKEYLDLAAVFGNGNPVELEIGCGFGSFVCEIAQRRPYINFIAVEKISNVIVTAAERAKAAGLTNVFFLNCAAEILPKYIRDGAIEKLYLNFSTPLPKQGYARQRLTHPRFLAEYSQLLKKGGTVIQKTDDRDFYYFSLESFKSCGYEIIESCEDLCALRDPQNIVTEYERKFIGEGKKIYRIIAAN